MDHLRHHNQTLEDNVLNLHQRRHVTYPTKEIFFLDLQPLPERIYGGWGVPESFKPPLLVKFDRRSDAQKNATSINMQIPIIRASNSFKVKNPLQNLQVNYTKVVYESSTIINHYV